ncbi:MAG: hypothetical protein ACRD0J_00120, partial [Acidimicrobiales bacterium]
EYLGLLSLNLPGGATHPSIQGISHYAAAGPEGPLTVLATPISILAGHHETMVAHFWLPAKHGSLTVLPSARVPPLSWITPKGHFQDTASHSISW